MSSSPLLIPDRAVILAPYEPMRYDLTTILKQQKIDVLQAEGPEHLLLIAKKKSVDFAVIGSEVVEGNKGLLADVRTTDPFLPVILLSAGKISPAVWDEALKVGLVGYIPAGELSPRELATSVHSLIEYRFEKQSAVYRTTDASAAVNRIMHVLDEVFGSREDAIRWLRSPHPDLGGRRPLSLVMRGDAEVVVELVEGSLAGTFS